MGKAWDSTGIAFNPAVWSEVLRVLAPGTYLMAFGGTRTFHRMTCAIEDAGFEIRDCLMWLYGTGFPKSKSCLKPSYEPIILARKPGKTSQPLNIDGCKIGDEIRLSPLCQGDSTYSGGWNGGKPSLVTGRWPANTILDESFADAEWSRYFYCAKASRKERDTGLQGFPLAPGIRTNAPRSSEDAKTEHHFNNHLTVKPLSLTEHLAKLILPQPSADGGRRLLVPFSGSGSEMIGGIKAGWDEVTGIELSTEYAAIAESRIEYWRAA